MISSQEHCLFLEANFDILSTLLTSLFTLVVVYAWKSLDISGNPFLNSEADRSDGKPKLDVDFKEVLKTRFSEEKIPKNLDAIIIGSGMGGLTCAACLAKTGKRVLVLERHGIAGGSTHVFKRKGFEFDVGVHYVGEMSPNSINRSLMDFLTDGQLLWDKMDKEFDRLVLNIGQKIKHYSYISGKNDYVKQIIKYFPEEEKEILEFLDLMQRSRAAIVGYIIMKQLPKWLVSILIKTGIHDLLFGGYSDFAKKTLGDVLNRLTRNAELKFVLGYAFGDYGTFPSEAPLLIHAVLMKHFEEGAYYPRGGSRQLAATLIPGIRKSGGAVLVKAPVDKILMNEKGAVRGVIVRRSEINVEIHAPIVISGAGIHNTYRHLIPPEVAQKFELPSVCEKLDTGMSCFQTFIGLRGSTEELNLKKTNYWVYDSIDVESSMKEYLSLSRSEALNAKLPLMFISFPSSKDSTWNYRHPGLSVCVAVTFVSWNWFKGWEDSKKGARDPEYNAIKQHLQNNIVNVVLKLFPQLEQKIEYVDSGTPLTHKHYLSCPRGDIYGVDHTVKRFDHELAVNIRPETPIPGLYLTGQDIFTCGVMGAALSGMISSGAVLGRNHFLDLFIAMGKSEVTKRVHSWSKSLF